MFMSTAVLWTAVIVWWMQNSVFFFLVFFSVELLLQCKRFRLLCTFLHSVVCLSVVCHVCAPCLNRSMDFDAIWHVHVWGPVTHCVRWGLWPPSRRGDFGVKPPVRACSCKLQPKRQSCRMQTSNSAFCQITLMLVFTFDPFFSGLVA